MHETSFIVSSHKLRLLLEQLFWEGKHIPSVLFLFFSVKVWLDPDHLNFSGTEKQEGATEGKV